MSSTKIVDLRAEALEYMDKNKVKVLFDILGSKLAKEKPANPNEFLQTELFKIQELKTANKPVVALYHLLYRFNHNSQHIID